jgi:hypothetical protein
MLANLNREASWNLDQIPGTDAVGKVMVGMGWVKESCSFGDHCSWMWKREGAESQPPPSIRRLPE